MSLIHDALKKAGAPSENQDRSQLPQFMQEMAEDKPKSNIRIIVLVVILVAAGIYMVYDRFVAGKPRPIARVAASADALDEAKSKEIQIKRLKSEAIKSFSKNNLEDAWVRFSTAGQLDPTDHEIWNGMGIVSKRKGDIVKSREFFEKALQMKPDYPECLNNIAVLDMDEGNLNGAKERFAKALSLRSDYADPAFNLAIIAEQEGDLRLAAAYYKKFIELKKDAPQKLLDDIRTHVTDIESE